LVILLSRVSEVEKHLHSLPPFLILTRYLSWPWFQSYQRIYYYVSLYMGTQLYPEFVDLADNLLYTFSFKGDDSTFGDFPPRLTHILQETIENVTVESLVFPAYEVSLLTTVTVFELRY
jgi:hypothetical protein